MKEKKSQENPENTPPSERIPSENPAPESAGANEAPSQEQSAAEKTTPMVGLTMEEYDALQRELEEHRKKSVDYFDGWQRERADFSNFRRRVERDTVQNQQNALISVVKKYLVVMDDLERALRMRPTTGEGAEWANGIELVYRKLQNLLEGEGITQMQAQGEMFDPTRHEAITQEDSADHQSGQIIDVVQSGYMLGERIVRPALVRVAR